MNRKKGKIKTDPLKLKVKKKKKRVGAFSPDPPINEAGNMIVIFHFHKNYNPY